MFPTLLALSLTAASPPGLTDSVPVLDDVAPETGWELGSQGSLALTGEERRGRKGSFPVRTLGSDPSSRLLRGWTQARLHAVRRGDEGGWSFLAEASPLAGAERLDSAASETRPLLQLREARLRLEHGRAVRLGAELGRRDPDPGAGLSFHPSRASPLPAPGPDLPEPDRRAPVGAALEAAWAAGCRSAVRVYPELDASGPNPFAASQSRWARFEQTLRPAEGHELQLVAGIGQFLSFGGSWERSRDAWFLSGEAALRDDAGPGRPARDASGTWSPTRPEGRFHLESALQVQRDFPAPAFGQLRLSLEWAFRGNGWSPDQARSVGRDLSALEAEPLRSAAGASARGTLGAFAQASPWVDAYAHRILVRLGSVESLRWGGGLDALWIGPADGLLLQADPHRSLGGRLSLEGNLASLVWSRPASPAGHLPLALRIRTGLRCDL